MWIAQLGTTLLAGIKQLARENFTAMRTLLMGLCFRDVCVNGDMNCERQHFHVFDSVVGANAVDVVNRLKSIKLSTKLDLHQVSVLKDWFAVYANTSVALFGDVSHHCIVTENSVVGE